MFGAAKEVKSKPVTIAKGGKLTIHVDLNFETDDIHLNEEAPNKFQVKAPATLTCTPAKTSLSEPKFDVVCHGSGSGEVRISANLYYCDVSGACSMGNVDFVVPFAEGGSGDSSRLEMSGATNDMDDWVDEDVNKCADFFSAATFASPSAFWKHAKSALDFDLPAIRSKYHMDSYDYIKLVNYLRQKGGDTKDPKSFLKALTFDANAPWRSEAYLKPTLEGDAFLFAIDDDEEGDWSDDEGSLLAPPDAKNLVNVDSLSKDELVSKVKRQDNALLEARMEMATLKETVAKLQAFSKQVLIGQEKDDSSTDSDGSSDEDEDGGYFGAYAHHGIHATMLKDKVRTEGYRDFIYDNAHLIKDKVVMDVGCGTGILSMFAAKAGAKKVFAVDKSQIINKAKMIAEENGLSHIITFINKKVELISEKDLGEFTNVDIIISEWMGYCLLFECMLPSVLVARDKWCRNGLVFPDRAKMLIATWTDAEFHHDRVDYWTDVYGFKMNSMKEGVIREPKIEVLPHTAVSSDAYLLKDFDINAVKIEDLDYKTDFSLTVQSASQVHGFVVYFDMDFLKSCTKPVFFSTGPLVEPTHWMQTIFYLPSPMAVAPGEVVKGSFECKRGSIYHRDLELELKYTISGSTEPIVLKYVLN